MGKFSRIRVHVSKFLVSCCVFSLLIGINSDSVAAVEDYKDVDTGEETRDFNGDEGSVSSAEGSVGDSSGRYELCANTDLTTFLPPPYGNLSAMACTPLWNNFVLRYKQRDDNVMTIIASAIYTSGWVGIGFSKDGRMIGSSAMVGWFTRKGVARIKQFYLQGYQPMQVVADQGELQLEKVPPVVVLQGAMVYLAFQVRFESRVGRQPIILAFGSRYPHNSHLSAHDDKTMIMFDFSRGSSSVIIQKDSKRTTHGVLGIMGWGLLLPLGAIFARHLKHKDPLWYYLHAGTQFMGFILGVAGVLLGLQLYDKINANMPSHKGIGIFLLVASILQVLAFFLRPSKDSKLREYWSSYHSWLGRISLFFGSLNIVLGIKLANAGIDWKIGYGFLLTLLLITVILLEALLRMRRVVVHTEKPQPPPPDFQINPVG